MVRVVRVMEWRRERAFWEAVRRGGGTVGREVRVRVWVREEMRVRSG